MLRAVAGGQTDVQTAAGAHGGWAGEKEMTQENLINWIREQAQRVSVWAFLERMGSEGGRYHAGYLQALEDVLKILKGGDNAQ